MHVGNQTELDSFEFSGGGIPVINKFLFNQNFKYNIDDIYFL